MYLLGNRQSSHEKFPSKYFPISIQKEISHVFARMTQNETREEIEDKFFLFT
jgi:hypothetical protein